MYYVEGSRCTLDVASESTPAAATAAAATEGDGDALSYFS